MAQKKLKLPSWKARKERGLTYFYYRTRIFLSSLGLAVVTTALLPPNFGPWGIELLMFCGSFISFVVFGDLLIYKILKRKESTKICSFELMKWDGLSLLQLDTFITKMANVRLITFLIGLSAFAISGFSIKYLDKILFAIFAVRICITMWLIIRKKLAIPLSYPASFDGSGCTRRRFEWMSSSHKIRSYTMDNAFYAGTGVITYRHR